MSTITDALERANTELSKSNYAQARAILIQQFDVTDSLGDLTVLRQLLGHCCVAEARAILDGRCALPDLGSIRQITGRLKGDLSFALARRLLQLVPLPQPQSPQARWVQQQIALCTYKDEEQTPARRLLAALEVLDKIGLRDPANTDVETLALGGAIFKRRWEHEGQVDHLYAALGFYLRAWQISLKAFNDDEQGFKTQPNTDLGYGGVNAAHILDILAARSSAVEKRTASSLHQAETLAGDAAALRREISDVLDRATQLVPSLEQNYWFLVTRAEVAFGLGKYDDAGRWLSQVHQLPALVQPTEWERQTTFRQLLAVARLHGQRPPRALPKDETWPQPWRALQAFLGEDTASALSCSRGKVGLALSGGGFRASFFHLGVLARMAELDMLRSVEVLSTVSGGSIVGAAYYLDLQRLYESKHDSDIDTSDYVTLVRNLQERFLRGVQQNLRMRALADLGANLRMVRDSNYTRSHRMGELYEEYLYAAPPDSNAAGDVTLPNGSVVSRHRSGKPHRLRELLIAPADSNGQPDYAFKPQFSNWRRSAKVPVLLLNTTSLNSGHLWHFTASFMGEPPGLLGSDIDANQRYRRLYYGQAPTTVLQDYWLGHAVAASACVPGLFDPLVIQGLYEGRTVRLVDGGVHDNQGVAGLLDQGCSLILCSDASGQMEDVAAPPGGLLAPLMRSSQSIFMSRIREAQFQDLRGRVDSRALSGLFFIHLKQGLPTRPVDWIQCDDPTPAATPTGNVTKYGIDFDVQRQLAGIRTDLDSFTEVEAYALMLSGYKMTKQQLADLNEEFHRDDGAGRESGTWSDFLEEVPETAGDPQWPFLALEAVVCQPKTSTDPRRKDLDEQLAASESLLLKVWRLYPQWSRRLWQVVGAGVAIFALWMSSQPDSLRSLPWALLVVVSTVLLVGGAAAAVTVWNYLVPKRPKHNYFGKGVAMIGGWVVAQLHLRFFDPQYLRRGELKRLLARSPEARPELKSRSRVQPG
ncbi:MAG: patatin-like phospholipase family protein [Deltaproteobacteria bacterium]|nr:patatin-like phospholipase family protein [Deltaproteobacteria bacterium]